MAVLCTIFLPLHTICKFEIIPEENIKVNINILHVSNIVQYGSRNAVFP